MKSNADENQQIEALYYTREGEGCRCSLCPQHCYIAPQGNGRCRARRMSAGKLWADSYGKLSSTGLDPVTKKPLYHWHPEQMILSVGSYGCNLACTFCQNFTISWEIPQTRFLSPQELVAIAASLPDNPGVAFTYNEPLISFEYLLETSQLLSQRNLAAVLITNGVISPQPLQELLPYIAAMNIDLKGFSEEFYRSVGGSLAWVLETIAAVYQRCHLEVTTLIIPGLNDSDTEMEAQAKWLAALSPEIPLHLSRYFARFRMTTPPPTPLATLQRLAGVARRYLKYVYIGNV